MSDGNTQQDGNPQQENAHAVAVQEPAPERSTAPVIRTDRERERLEDRRFLVGIQQAVVAAKRAGLTLRIVPMLYDPTKRTYRQWPGRAWMVNLVGPHEAEEILAVLAEAFEAYQRSGATATIKRLLGDTLHDDER
jgi:hypothetical protein